MVLAAAAHNPNVSSRQIARETRLSKTSILRIFKKHKYHPYHVSLHQELHGDDFRNRVEFCRWALHQIKNNRRFIASVFFTDESTFTNRGPINLQNMHYWAPENPHWLREVDHQRPWSVNVWCGIVDRKIIGPYFIDGALNGQKYANFLDTTLPELLENVTLERRRGMWYQHDGCPAHFSRNAQEILNRDYHNRWIGRGGPVAWPARSPDLTCLDFYLWGKLKNICYERPPTTADDMRQRIIAACNQISTQELEAVEVSFSNRLHKCLEANGHQFEHLFSD